MRRVRDAALAEDVAQETLRRALEALRDNRVRNPDALASFLFETARNVCSHHARSAGRQARAFGVLGSEESLFDNSGDALESLLSLEQRQKVQEALANLGRSDRELLVLIYVDGLDNSQIAERLRQKPGTVRVKRHRALDRLAALLNVTRRTERGQV
jgi:RNA polymerase sigma-70 factor (ECF subfamily)